MRAYVKENVYTQSRKRIEWVLNEFRGHIMCTSSGGKDSTVVMEIALEVIREYQDKGILPKDYKLKLLWLDQEAEWTHTVDYMTYLAERDDVELYWIQVPMKLGTNAEMSGEDNYIISYDPNYDGEYCQPLSKHAYDKLYVDENGKPVPIDVLNEHRKIVDGKWVYDKEFDFVEVDNKRFYELFDTVQTWVTGGESYGILQGVKASESPRRAMQVQYQLGYKGITWASRGGLNMESIRFSVIYDWSRVDNFVYFEKTGCEYNKMYDEFLRYGMKPSTMRVSNLIHETAVVHSLTILQEVDRELYNRMVDRLPGISTYSQLQGDTQNIELPSNFSNWEEFGRYLIDKVIHEKHKQVFLNMYETKSYKNLMDDPVVKVAMDKLIVQSVLTKDVDKTKWANGINEITKKHSVEDKYGR